MQNQGGAGIHSTIESRIGRNIRRLCEQQGLTQEQLSAKLQVNGCDLTRSALAKIEVGQCHVYPEEILSLKKVLKVSFEDLFDLS